ncbi:MAG: 3-hydroxyanthranilate 3,4-dioxygenase, partial [Dehalococcoidia bacterium]|nr:3-hydroxyanthranilate 3,4-dioxygenase [Dehalococcoidia bacterium]
KPPVCNKLIFQDAGFIVMVIGGPNERKDYHFDESEEFFYQVEGDMVLRVMQNGRPADIPIREGEVFLLPAKMPHSPQRKADTVGLVIERERMDGEQDGLIWFCEDCHHKLYAEYFKLENIETQLPTVFDRFYGSLEDRTCDQCGAVMERP